MEFSTHQKYVLPDRSYSGIVKKEIRKQGQALGFSANKIGVLDVIVSELVSNLVKYGKSTGEFLVRTIDQDDHQGLEIICIDHGVGMEYPEEMLGDGTSTSGTLGQGLGAIKRLSHEFDLYSRPKWGTIVLSRLYIKPKEKYFTDKLSYGGVVVTARHEKSCGDRWNIINRRNILHTLVVDGLGHGELAEEAAVVAMNFFQQNWKTAPSDFIKKLHGQLTHTRGGVCLYATINMKTNTITYSGVGNIAARLISLDESKSFLSANGIVGFTIPNKIMEKNVEWNQGNFLVIHSDGIQSRWNLDNLPFIERHDPSVIAAAIYKDFNRGYDDSLVLVIKEK